MRPELVFASLLNVSGVTSLVATRLARARLPENSTYPALVYEQIDGVPVPPINANAGGNVSRSRVQVMALGRRLDEVDSVLEAARVACSFKSGLINGVQVVGVVPDLVGPVLRDDEASVFTQTMDFMVTHYET